MWRRTARDRVFITLLIAATVTVLTLDFRTGVLDGVAGAASQAVGFFQGGLRTVVSPFEAVVDTVHDFGSLREENRKLAEENRQLRLQSQTFEDVARENARIRALLQLEGSSGLQGVHARVIGASLSGLERSATIDKGRSDGIEPNLAVLAPEGLAGRVVWAASGSSKVLLLSDSRSAVGVRIGQSGETGLVQGTGGRNLELELVSRSALDQGGVKPGDVVVTSGYQGGVYPSGIPVGRIEQVTLAPRGVDYTITVRPFVPFSQLDVLSAVVGAGEVIEPVPTTPSPEDDA